MKKMSVKLLGKERSGDTLLQVTGLWLGDREKRNPKAFDFFRAMEQAPLFGLGNPTIDSKGIKFSIVAEPSKIKELLEGLEKFNIEYKVHNLSKLRGRNRTLLGDLTRQQLRVLNLAHTLGYYEIPRKQGTEDLARILDMDTATVGEHIRRAEKHVFDELFK
jgi:HTH DNA binding domain